MMNPIPEEEILDSHAIQGNSLAGFNKDFQAFVFLRILDVSGARAWLQGISAAVAASSLAEVHSFNRLFRVIKVKTAADPIGLAATWVNVAFSFQGVAHIASQTEAEVLSDPAFQNGLFSESPSLGDPLDRSQWKFGGSEETDAHVMLIVASDTVQHLRATVSSMKKQILAARDTNGKRALKILWTQPGATLDGDLRGHEHFGFRDSISQPGVRGFVTLDRSQLLTPRLLPPSDPRSQLYSKPGQRLLWPGQFVLGYFRQDDALDPQPLEPEDVPAWAKNGSYVVFRRLRQDVEGFWKFMQQTAARLSTMPQFEGIDHIRLASLLIGRWPSGTPVMLSPDRDDPTLAEDDDRVNDFDFHHDDPSEEVRGRCPFAAHIRKANPRVDPVEGGGPKSTLTRLMLRRGIPYGTPKDSDRGLLFVSYQRSIFSQFQFINQQWAGTEDLPLPNAGRDPVIGQNGGDSRARRVLLKGAEITLPTDFVVPTGGGYFFSPSIPTLQQWASR
jgi:Dyp-type peroxidase family